MIVLVLFSLGLSTAASLDCYNCNHYDVNNVQHSCQVLKCNKGEFCKMETDHSTKVHGHCEDIHQLAHCHATPSCIPFHENKCTFCCDTDEEVHKTFQQPTESLACYNCHHYDVNSIGHSCDVLHCGVGEFCKMETDHNNKVTGTCAKINEMRHCQEHVTSSCIPFYHDKCTFCCSTGECVSNSLQAPAIHHPQPTSSITLPTVVQTTSVTNVRPSEYLECYNCHHFDVNNRYHSCEILHCGFGEFCKMETDHDNKVTGTCEKVHEMRHCQEHVTSSCIPFVHDKCTFCCATGECVSQSLQLPAIHHPQPTSTITLPTVVQATSKTTVRPSEYLECYNCHHFDVNNIYYSCEILHCGFGEFCMMETDHDDKVTGRCSSVHEMNHCQEHVSSSCIPFYHHKCTFCCSTGECVSQALQLPDTSHNPTPSAYRQSTTSTPATTSTGGMTSRSTHLPDTSHNPTPTASTTSTPATTSTGGLTSRSTHLPVTTKPVDLCQDHDPICSTMMDICSNPVGRYMCGKTCNSCSTGTIKPVDPCQDHDPICSTMMGICSSSVGRYMCGKTCNSCSTGTTKPVDPCQDHDPICSTMMGICSNPVGLHLCGKTCNSCSTGTTKPVDPCQDHDPVCTTMVGICNNPIGPHMCGKTCNSCSTGTAATTTGIPSAPTTPAATTTGIPSAPTTTSATTTGIPSAPTTTSATTTGIPSAPTTTSATTTATTPAAKSGSSSSTISVSTLSVSTPPAATNGNTSAHVSRASARTSTTGKPSHRTCYQCGDITKGTFCTIGQTIMPSSSPCPADKAFCMTDLFHHIDGSTKYIRRCVAQVMCLRQWYQQTSDKSECVDIDPTTISTDITCRYCCTTDDCNSGNMPVRNTLYKPKH